MEQSTVDLRDGGEIKPYNIHVSSKYLDLTRKKLELTRLPHELLVPSPREWDYGTPKSEIEPLIDFWLERYSWRARETTLNATFAQFRTAISIPTNPHPIRVHFLHIRSPHAHAIPLLLLPSFPFPNLSPLITPLFRPLTEDSTQPFHLVVPSIPGLGFSDAFQSDENLLQQTAELFNILMKERLGYEFYLTSGTGSGRASPAGIDHYLARLIGERHAESCLGVHLIEPLADRPRVGSWAWTKFTLARFFHARLFGYTAGDFQSLRKGQRRSLDHRGDTLSTRTGFGAVGMLGLREPNTLAYALCDSPVGLLSLVCSALRKVSPNHSLSREDVIDVTQMAWLPGPEAGMRFWSMAAEEIKALKYAKGKKKVRAAVTVFEETEAEGYVCPAWANGVFDVLWAQRVEGRTGLLAFDRTEVLLDGIRGLATAVDGVDGRLRLSALEGVVVGQETIEEEHEEADESLGQWEVESPDTVVGVSVR